MPTPRVSYSNSLPSFDEPDFDRVGTTFNVDDWISHTPRSVLAKNFGVDPAVFDKTPSPNPYILNATLGTDGDRTVIGGGQAVQDGSSASFVYRTLTFPGERVPGGGGEIHKIDSTNFPISETIAATFVRLQAGGLRELHWHPNVSRIAVLQRSTQEFLSNDALRDALDRANNATDGHRLKSGCTSTLALGERQCSSATRMRAHLISSQATPLRSLIIRGQFRFLILLSICLYTPQTNLSISHMLFSVS